MPCGQTRLFKKMDIRYLNICILTIILPYILFTNCVLAKKHETEEPRFQQKTLSKEQMKTLKQKAKDSQKKVNLDKEWNPYNIRLSDNPADWPGHLQPFGSKGRFHVVDTKKKAPTSQEFFKKYVSSVEPLIIRNATKTTGSTAYKKWHNDTYFSNHPLSNTHWFPIGPGQDVTFKTFIQQYQAEHFVYDDQVPFFLSDDVPLSNLLLCEMVVRNLSQHWLFIGGDNRQEPIRQREDDTLRCIFSGQQNITLVNYSKFGHKMPHQAGNVDVNKVDYSEFSSMREVEYHKAVISRGDCIYIPHNWYWQVNSINYSKSIDVTWHPKVKSVDPAECASFEEEPTISKAEFSEDTAWAAAKKFIIVHYFAGYLTETKNHTYATFVTAVMKDKNLFEKLLEWNDEYEEITRELFEVLDTNNDQSYSIADLEALTPEIVMETYGLLEDRLGDYEDVMNDQQLELQEQKDQSKTEEVTTPTPVTQPIPAAIEGLEPNMDVKEYVGNYINMIQDVLKESMDQMTTTGQIPDLEKKLAEAKLRMDNSFNLPDNLLEGVDKPKRSKRDKKRNDKQQKDKDMSLENEVEFSQSDTYDIVDDSVVEEIMADDDDEVITTVDNLETKQNKEDSSNAQLNSQEKCKERDSEFKVKNNAKIEKNVGDDSVNNKAKIEKNVGDDSVKKSDKKSQKEEL